MSLSLPLTPGDENTKIANMADAMREARIKARALENPEFVEEESDPDPYGYASELEQNYGVELLEPRWKSKPDDQRWVSRLRGRARKAEVAKLFLLGSTVQEIAQKLEVSETTIYRDLDHVQRDWRRSYLDDIEILAGKDLARLDYMIQKLAAGIEAGDVKSITAAIEIIKTRTDILGYRQGIQVNIEQYIREVAESAGYDPDKAVALAQRISISMK